MNFVVTRTSFYGSTEIGPPCEGAYLAVVTITEARHYGAHNEDAEEYWHRKGHNHRRRDDGYRLREIDDEVWLIDLEWSDLEAFIARYGDIVIALWSKDEKRLLLEIYDGWRE